MSAGKTAQRLRTTTANLPNEGTTALKQNRSCRSILAYFNDQSHYSTNCIHQSYLMLTILIGNPQEYDKFDCIAIWQWCVIFTIPDSQILDRTFSHLENSVLYIFNLVSFERRVHIIGTIVQLRHRKCLSAILLQCNPLKIGMANILQSTVLISELSGGKVSMLISRLC